MLCLCGGSHVVPQLSTFPWEFSGALVSGLVWESLGGGEVVLGELGLTIHNHWTQLILSLTLHIYLKILESGQIS